MFAARGACLGLLFVAACSSKEPSPPAPTTSPKTAPASKPTIEIKELVVSWGGNPIARMFTDGRTESVGNATPGPAAKFSPGPTFRADGTVTLTKGGFQASVATNGDIFLVQPGTPPERMRVGRVTPTEFFLADDAEPGIKLEGSRLVMYANGKPTHEIGTVEPASMGSTALVMASVLLLEVGITAP